MLGAFYRVVWILLHTFASIYNTIYLFISYAKFRAGSILASLVKAGAYDDLQYLEQCKKDLTKTPKHLSIIVGTNSVSGEVLSKVAVYALISDIDYISYYDVKGEFTLDRVEIPKYIETREMPNGRFLWSMTSSRRKSTGQLRYKNGLDKSIEVVVLSTADGKPLLADASRELWSKRSDATIKEAVSSKDALATCITTALGRRLGNLPETDLAIIFDETMCTYGLLPWHTRFAEFHCIKNVKCFDVESFANVLYKFSKCEQRFGK